MKLFTTIVCEFSLFFSRVNMWESVPDFLELFRNFPVSISVLFVVPVVLLSGPASPVMAAHEFPVFRMQQFDLHQTQSGKSSLLMNKIIFKLCNQAGKRMVKRQIRIFASHNSGLIVDCACCSCLAYNFRQVSSD